MERYDEATYGGRIADVYDEWFGENLGGETAVACLRQLAGPGPVLELGIGTGRLALPLADTGLHVEGIDTSESMVARLRSKPGGRNIPVAIDNFAHVNVSGTFSLVFVAFNTFFALLSQEEQVECFRNVARRLAPGGVFVIEAFVPDLGRFDRGQRTSVQSMDEQAIRIDVARHDATAQRISTRHLMITEDGIRFYPVELRYAWPAELDLMARLAGMRLRNRWDNWRGEAFTSDSGAHVSIYEAA
ncbi:MAG TPA: class I SAM-dependent methyltransferase [Terriglobia bacterium]|nr:class I SAM-dependent methyltransferase [Terriglobia bacterium]